MAFAPGQFITAQRLNRLQSTAYWAQSTGAVAGAGVAADIAGTSMNITVETDGATVEMEWSATTYTGATMGANMNSVAAVWDGTSAPTFAIFLATASHRCTPSANWTTTVPTAGTYTAKLRGTIQSPSTLQIYTVLNVRVTEVA